MRSVGPVQHFVGQASRMPWIGAGLDKVALLRMFPGARLVFVEGPTAGDGGPQGGEDPPPGLAGSASAGARRTVSADT